MDGLNVDIGRCALPPAETDLRGLAALLVQAVEAGEAVSFLSPLTADAASAFWRVAVERLPSRGAVLLARDAQGLAGTVSLVPAWAPNQPHRAEIVKLLVHPRCRGRGLGARLMSEAEAAARREGFDLLTLDAKRGTAAERLYRRLGWTPVGTIPDFALDPDGLTKHDAALFYKRLGA